MDIQDFATRLNTTIKNPKHKKDGKKQAEEGLKSVEIGLNILFYTQAWYLLETVLDDWEDIICQYLSVLGNKHWSEAGYTGPKKADRELLTRNLYSGCMCFTEHSVQIEWKAENPPNGLLSHIHSSWFGVRLVFSTKKYKNALGGGVKDYYFQVLDKCGYHGHFKEMDDLALALIESSDRGPYFKPNTDLV